MFWRRGYTLRGEVGGGWALEFPSFLGPVKWHRADRRVPFARIRKEASKRFFHISNATVNLGFLYQTRVQCFKSLGLLKCVW
jgi:hypothetical protein